MATPVLAVAVAPDQPDMLQLAPVGRYETGLFDQAAAEIVAYDDRSRRLFVVNAAQAQVEVLDARTPSAPTKLFDLMTVGVVAADGSTIPAGAIANSVDVRADGLTAVAVQSNPKTDDGYVVFFDGRSDSGQAMGAVRVGALPDMLTFTADGSRVLVANEGEPSEDFTVDPEGSIAVIDVPRAHTRPFRVPSQSDVRIADFHAYEDGGPRRLPEGVRIFGPTVNEEFPVSANLEPEYITVDRASRTAYATLQEANAIAVVDISTATVTEIWPLGTKDHSVEGNGIDPSDRDGAINIHPVPVRGMYQPDAIASYTHQGQTYLVTANEGDVREWGGYEEAARVGDLGEDGLAPLCTDVFADDVTDNDQLGRLNVSTASGLRADGSCYEELYAFGARSFSIWTIDGELVWDSGDSFEQITAEANPDFFNSNHTESNFEGRSDDKGPEPEGVDIGVVGGRTYAFISLERVGGIVAYDISDPRGPIFATYVNNRDFSVSVEDDGEEMLSLAGDLGPEGIVFIPASKSPLRGTPMLAVANEVSGTTALFSADDRGQRRRAP